VNGPGEEPPVQAQVAPRAPRSPRRRWLRRTAGLAFLILLCIGGWLGISGYRAYAELSAAKDHLEAAKQALLRADSATAQGEVDLAVDNAAAARGNTSTVLWDVVAAVPGVGQPFDAAAKISAAVDELAVQVLRPAASAGAALAPDTLRGADGAINLDALVSARAPLQHAATAAARLSATVNAIPSGGYVDTVEAAREQLQVQTRELVGLLNTATDAATIVPPMLGSDGPRTYFFAFQTNAEARGTGGLLGSFAILRTDHGHVSVVKMGSGSNADLVDQGSNPVNLGPEFAQQGYIGNSTTAWGNSNISANFPYVAQIWASLWQLQSGQRVDGVMATDPVALGYLLDVVGGLTLPDGQFVDGDNFVQITESEIYEKFPGLDGADRDARKVYEQGISGELVQKIIGDSGGHTVDLLRALGKAAAEGRLDLWSALPDEQAVLDPTPLGHEVPDDSAPYAGLVVNNSSHGKLDYYLGRAVNYTAGGCGQPNRQSTVAATLTNNAPPQGLPTFVTIGSPPGPVGTNRSDVTLYATAGAQLTAVTVNGVPAAAKPGTERGHPVFTINVEIPPGAAVVVIFVLTEPTAAGRARVPIQPLVLPMDVTTDVPVCGAGG